MRVSGYFKPLVFKSGSQKSVSRSRIHPRGLYPRRSLRLISLYVFLLLPAATATLYRARLTVKQYSAVWIEHRE